MPFTTIFKQITAVATRLLEEPYSDDTVALIEQYNLFFDQLMQIAESEGASRPQLIALKDLNTKVADRLASFKRDLEQAAGGAGRKVAVNRVYQNVYIDKSIGINKKS